MSKFDFNSIIKALNSSRIDVQVPAVETAAEMINELAAKAVNALKKGPHRFFVAQRLYLLGSAAIPHLENLFKKSKNSEVKTLASLALLGLGVRVGIPYLLDTIVENEEYGSIAAHHLALENIKDAIEPIVKRLESCDVEKVDEIVSLLGSLEQLGGDLPPKLLQCFSSKDVAWRIRLAVWSLQTIRQGFCGINDFDEFHEAFTAEGYFRSLLEKYKKNQ